MVHSKKTQQNKKNPIHIKKLKQIVSVLSSVELFSLLSILLLKKKNEAGSGYVAETGLELNVKPKWP